jgi:hypothetical protein
VSDELFENDRKILGRAAAVLDEVGMPTAAELVRKYSSMTKMREYLEKAIEAGIAGEREKIAMEYEIKRRMDLFRIRLEYKIALSAVGSSGMTTQGYRAFWG